MIHGFAQILCAPTGAHVEPMDAVAAHQSFLREACEIAGRSRAFQAMQQDYLPARRLARVMLERDNRRTRSDRILFANCGKALLIDFTGPEIASNREQMRIAENWPKLGQISDYCTRSLFLLRSSERIMASASSRIGRRNRRLSFRKRRYASSSVKVWR